MQVGSRQVKVKASKGQKATSLLLANWPMTFGRPTLLTDCRGALKVMHTFKTGIASRIPWQDTIVFICKIQDICQQLDAMETL